MSTSMIVRRSVAVLASTGVAAALALVPAGAHASVHGEYAAVGSAEADYVGPTVGGTCALTSGVDDPVGPIHSFSHGTKHSSVDMAETFTSSDNSSDQVTVKGHVDTSLTLKRKHNDLSAFELTAGGSISIKHAVPGSVCHANGSVLAVLPELAFTEHKKGWIYLTRDTLKPNSFSELILVSEKTNSAIALDIFAGSASHVTSRALLKPGAYELEETECGLEIGGAGILGKAQVLSQKAAQTIHLQGQFKPVKH
jgi:hypothetical protein